METTEQHGQGRALVYSFLCGALTGVTLAVLFAPARGRDTRERLVAKAQEGRDQASKMLERGRAAVDRTRAYVSDQTRHASRAVTEGRAALADMRERGEQALDTIGEEAAEAITDAKAAYKAVRTEITRPPDK